MSVQGSPCSSLLFISLLILYLDIAQVHLFSSWLSSFGLLRGSIHISYRGTLWREVNLVRWGQVHLNSSIHKLIVRALLWRDNDGAGWGVCMTTATTSMSSELLGYHLSSSHPYIGQCNICWGRWPSCQITLRTSPLAGPAMEVLILGLTLEEEDNNVSTPAEETVTVGTVPLVTMRDEQDGGPTTNEEVSSSSSSRGGMSMRLGQ